MSDPIVPSSAPASNAPSANNNVSENVPANTQSAKVPDGKPVDTSKNAPVAAAEKKAEVIRKLRLKVDKQEMELPEDEVIKLAQLGTSSQKRFQEAAQVKKQAEEFFKMLKDGDLEQLLSNPAVGRDPRKWAEEYLARQLEADILTPEQKEKKKFEQERAQFEAEKAEKIKQEKMLEDQQMQQKYAQEFDKQFTEVLSTSGLPKTQFTVKRLANYMEQAIKDGMEDVTPADLVPLVRQDYMQEVSDLFSQTDGDALLQLLGDGVANKIRKADLARLKGPVTPKPQDLATGGQPKTDESATLPKKPMNVHEWRAWRESQRKS